LIAAAATMAGGLGFAVAAHTSERRIHNGIAFGAGFMLAAVFISMIPGSFEHSAHASLWILGGYVLAHLFEHTFTSHFHFGEETHTEHMATTAVGSTALVGLALHALFDGIAISTGFLISTALGVFISLAVILHKIPEGITITSVMLASGHSYRRSVGASGVLAAATLLGSVAMHWFGTLRGSALGISSGIAIYVAATDLIPEINQRREKAYTLSAACGITVYFGIHWLLVAVGIHG